MATRGGREGLSIGQLSQQTGCNIETIRYYERVGVLPAPARTPGGQRLYEAAHLVRLRFVLRARGFDFGLAEVRALVALRDSAEPACPIAKSLADRHLATLQARITVLQGVVQRLEQLLQIPDDDARPSPILTALDADG